jgi:uncharacterized repeat protein (TIGR03803 family)
MAILAALLLVLSCLAPAHAQKKPAVEFLTLYSFSALAANNTNSDGANPSSLAVAPNGDLIGTAQSGGAHGEGAIFKLTAQGSFRLFYSFSAVAGSMGANSDGATPLAALTLGSDGRYYGAASAGGTAGSGTLFAIDDSGKLMTLYSFSETMGSVTSNPEGAQPAASLLLARDGNLYGVARAGGQGGVGTLYQFSQSGQLHLLYSFDPSIDFSTNEKGGQPSSPLVQASDGTFYGCAARYGANGSGAILRMTPGGDVSVVHAFSLLDGKGSNPDGASPSGLTLGADGSLYGTASLGGKRGTGAIFQISDDGKLTILYTFSGVKGKRHGNADGAYPQGPLRLASDGNFYGVTSGGGTGGAGTIFRISPAGVFETLYAFSAINSANTNPDGADPTGALVQGNNGMLYGVAAKGGARGTGTVFRITMPVSSKP